MESPVPAVPAVSYAESDETTLYGHHGQAEVLHKHNIILGPTIPRFMLRVQYYGAEE